MTSLIRVVRKTRADGLSDRQLAFLLVIPAAILLLAFAVYPFLIAADNGFFNVDLLTGHRTFAGLDNFAKVVGDPDIQAAFARSVAWTIANVIIQVCAGVGVALLLNAKMRGQTIIRGLVLFPYMVPAIVAALVFRFLFSDTTGLVNYLLVASGISHTPISFLSSPDTVLATLVIVNCWKYVPFMVILALARLQTVPRDLYDAASIDGAGRIATFWNVVLPWLMPVLIVAALLRTIWTAYDFDLPYLLAFGGPLGASTTIPIEIKTLAYGQQEIGVASALAVCVAILLTVSAYFFLRAYGRSERRLS